MKRFENVPVRILNIGVFKKGAATYIPYIGIILGKNYANNKNTLRHEFGHYLQHQKYGIFKFLRYVALDSVLSFRNSNKKSKLWFRHYDTWTEWSANRLSWEYFNRPSDWDMHHYPICVNYTREGCKFPLALSKEYKQMIDEYPNINYVLS